MQKAEILVDMERLIAITGDIIQRRSVKLDGTIDSENFSLFSSIREAVIIPTVISPESMKEVWGTIRTGFDAGVDGSLTILECTAELKIRSGFSGKDWAEVCKLIGRSASFDTSTYENYAVPRKTTETLPAIPVATRSNVVNDIVAEELVEANHWFVFVTLATLCTPVVGKRARNV